MQRQVGEKRNSSTLGTALWASLMAQMVICLQYRRPGFNHWVGKISWRREWQPTPVFLPGESHGQRSLEGYSPQSHKEPDTNEQLTNTFPFLETLLTSDSQARGGIVFWERLLFPRSETKGPRSGAWQPLPGDPSVEQAGRKAGQGWPGPPPSFQFQEGLAGGLWGGGGVPPPPLAAFSVSGFTLSSAFSTLILFGLGVIFPALHLFLCGTSKRRSLTGRGLCV